MNDGREHLVLDLPSRGHEAMAGPASLGLPMAARRAIMLGLVLATFSSVLALLGFVLGANGWSLVDTGLMIAFALSAPWTIIGFWNAAIGLALVRLSRDPLAHAAPFAARGRGEAPVTTRTAVLMTLRNEQPARAFDRLRIVMASLDATGQGAQFDCFVLSDTSDPAVAAEEEAEAAVCAAQRAGRGAFHYRRREVNTGFKAGNLRDFCERWGDAYDFMLPLDADSLMLGDTILRLVRICQENPRIGILQSLVVGLPAVSGFARVFQYGMRHGMRSYTMGSAWWQGDCGPYWGHNALIRVQPFRVHCDLPVLPGSAPLGGHVLSHDQVEAVLMRRAGYEVRVLPEECGSWEENPPTLPDFTKRDLRWCQGNMQYFKLLAMPGLLTVSRIQLVLAILMYLGTAAWIGFIMLGAALAYEVASDAAAFPVWPGLILFGIMYGMSLAPKLAGLLDVLPSASERARYGGFGAILKSAALEFAFTTLLAPLAAVRVSIFMGGLLLGRSIVWDAQERDDHGVAWRDAVKGLWPQALLGWTLALALGWANPPALMWAAPVLAALLLGIPYAVVSASPAFGAFCKRHGFCIIPEELSTPVEIQMLRDGRPQTMTAVAA